MPDREPRRRALLFIVNRNRRQRVSMRDHGRLVADDRLQYGDRVRQLLTGALEFSEGSVGPAMPALALETAQTPARIAHRLPGSLQVAVHVAELKRPGALLWGERAVVLSLNVRPFLRRQVGDIRRFGQQRAFGGRE